jgi:hypothetical protein
LDEGQHLTDLLRRLVKPLIGGRLLGSAGNAGGLATASAVADMLSAVARIRAAASASVSSDRRTTRSKPPGFPSTVLCRCSFFSYSS